MAKDKKSFILYCDLIHTIEKMPPEKAGELFLHILKYVNDCDPKSEDLVINLTFEPIKQQFKRDLIKYENICKRNAVNGSGGGRPKNPEEPKKPSGLSGKPKKPRKADNDNGSDTDILKPSLIQFLDYCKGIKEIDYREYEFALKSKYEAWENNEWKDGNDSHIKNWKSKIKNTIPYLRPIKQSNNNGSLTNGYA